MFGKSVTEKGGTGGRETGRKGGWRCTGGRRRGGGKREKKGKITQHCAIFRKRTNAKRREPKNTGREPGLKGMGSGRLKPPCPPPPPENAVLENREKNMGVGETFGVMGGGGREVAGG